MRRREGGGSGCSKGISPLLATVLKPLSLGKKGPWVQRKYYTKGISPLLATVLLIAATVVTTTMLSGWVSTTMSTTQSTVANKTNEGVACAAAEIIIDDVYSGAGSNSTASVIVRNSGNTDNLAITSAQLYDRLGNNFTTTNSLPTNLNRGQMATFTFKNIVLHGTTNDSSHGINNGTLTNGALFKLGGKYQSGMGFDGNNNTIVVPTSASLNVTGNITITAWLKANSIPTGDVEIVSKGSYSLYMSNGEVAGAVNLNNNNTVWNISTNPSSGTDLLYSTAVDKDNNIIVGGYDASPGNQQWRVMKFDTNGNSLWNYTYNPTSGNDIIYSVAVDSKSNIIASGVENTGGNRWLVIKLDTNGNHIWNYTSNPSDNSETAYGVGVDSNDNVIVGGTDRSQGSSNSQMRVEKLNSNGVNLWNYTVDFSSSDNDAVYINGIAVDSNDSIIVGGIAIISGWDWAIVKLNSTGSQLWNYTTVISSNTDYIFGVSVDKNDNIVAAGQDLTNGGTDRQWRVMKFDRSGNSLWNYTSDMTSGSDTDYQAAFDSNSNIIVAGLDNIPGNNQIRIMKFDSSGKSLWNYTVNPSSGLDLAYSLSIDKNDNIVVGGVDNVPGGSDYQWHIIKLGNLANGTTTLSAGTWYHGAFVYNGTHINIYRDGILEGSNGATGSIQDSFWNMSLGAKGGVSYKYGVNFPIGIGNNFNGTIDDIAIWNRSLTNDEINTSRNQGPLTVSNTNDLVGYWKFDEGKGMTTCPDDFSRVVVTTNCGGVSTEFSKPPKC